VQILAVGGLSAVVDGVDLPETGLLAPLRRYAEGRPRRDAGDLLPQQRGEYLPALVPEKRLDRLPAPLV